MELVNGLTKETVGVEATKEILCGRLRTYKSRILQNGIEIIFLALLQVKLINIWIPTLIQMPQSKETLQGM